MPSPIPAAIQGQKYISLTSFRKNGQAVATPVWCGEEDSKLFVMTRSTSGKYKRIRNNPRVRVAPCTILGVVTGPEFAATARILPVEDHARARKAINRKYWAARIPFLWWRTDAYLEITLFLRQELCDKGALQRPRMHDFDAPAHSFPRSVRVAKLMLRSFTPAMRPC